MWGQPHPCWPSTSAVWGALGEALGEAEQVGPLRCVRGPQGSQEAHRVVTLPADRQEARSRREAVTQPCGRRGEEWR